MELHLVKKNGVLEAQFDAPDWGQGEKIIAHLKKRFDARVVDKAEGPDARTWTLEIEGVPFVANQWDTGDISLFAKVPEGNPLTERIAKSIGQEVS